MREIKQDNVVASSKHRVLFSQVSRKRPSVNETWWMVENWKQNNGDMCGKQKGSQCG